MILGGIRNNQLTLHPVVKKQTNKQTQLHHMHMRCGTFSARGTQQRNLSTLRLAEFKHDTRVQTAFR